MKILDAYKQLNIWLDLSNGEPITISENLIFSFKRLKTFNKEELLSSQVHLPKEYIDFLINVGEVELFVNDCGIGVEIFSPEKVKAFSEEVFDNFSDNLYPNIFLVVSMPIFGYFAGFNTQDYSDRNFSIFYADIPAEYWIDESSFFNFNEWIIHLTKTKFDKGVRIK